MKQIAVLGLGRFGRALAVALETMGHQVLGVDDDAEIVDEMAGQLTDAAQANVQDEAALAALGVRNFDTVVVCIGEDIEASIIATMILKEMNVSNIVCKANSNLHAKILSRLGADRVVFPERDMAIRLARGIANANVVDYIELSGAHSMVEVHTPHEWADQSIGASNIRARYGINIVAVRRGEEMIVAPGPDTVLQPDDVLMVIGSNEALSRFDNGR